MKIGIDIDETIADAVDLIKEYMKKFDPNIPLEQIHNLPNEFWCTYGEEIYSKVEFKPWVKEAFVKLREIGHKIIIITAREFRKEYDIIKLTEDMFKRHNVIYDKIIYHSIPKGPDADKEGIDLFMDDLDHNLESVSSYNIDVIKIVEEYNNNSKYREFTNWNDLYLYIQLWGRENA